MDISKLFDWIKLQPRYLTPILLATGIILFVPIRFIEKLGLQKLQGEFKSWVGVIFLLSFALIATHISVSTWNRFRKKVRENRGKAELQKKLHSLSIQEKEILRNYIGNNTKSQTLNFANGIANGLEASGIIYRASIIGSLYGFAYNIQPWAWEYLNENPELLN